MESIPEAPLGPTKATGVPVIGYGTAAWPFGGSKTMRESILQAIELGYRHFDTAAVYQSEECLGEALAEALKLGLVKSRKELFITSKLWCSDAHPHRVIPALRDTLNSKDLVPLDFKSVWEAMEECHRLGLSRNIGVSNFSCKKLEHLLLTSKIPPAVNQVEMSPLWQQAKLREFCHKKGIHITAYSTLGARGTVWETNQVLDCEALKEIAEVKGKTVAQICLRWVYEQGVSFVVKSFNKERMKENLSIFDWMLSPEECRKIAQIPQQRAVLGSEILSEDGPYKTVEEIWDYEDE